MSDKAHLTQTKRVMNSDQGKNQSRPELTPRLRVPAEWEPYNTVMLAWPHHDTDWAPMLDEVKRCYAQITKAIVDSGLRLLIVAPHAESPTEDLQKYLAKTDYDAILDKVTCYAVQTNDTWTRDYGPIALEVTPSGEEIATTYALDFKFNGWGLKFAANHDNMVNRRLWQSQVFTPNYRSHLDFALEGGSIESDGNGTMLTTASCLMSLNRNGEVTEEYLRDYFRRNLGVERLHILHHGQLIGDDTDGHIDTLARLAPNDTILYVKSYNKSDSHTAELDLMEEELKALRTAEGAPYNLIALPLPDPIYGTSDPEEEPERLPATYANFLITLQTIIMPVYGQVANDQLAEQMLKIAFPTHRIITVDCNALIKQHGSLHCATMQLKKELLNI